MHSPSTSPDADARRSDVRSIAKRYRRVERAVVWLVALAAAVTFLVAFALADLVPALAVAAALVVAFRAPILRRSGTTRLRTDAAPEAVVEAFASATPPVLAFQWGTADEIRPASGGGDATYEHSALLGLRTYSLAVETEAEGTREVDAVAGADDDGDGDGGADVVSDGGEGDTGGPLARVHIEGTLDGEPWAAYSVAVRGAGDGEPGGTVVDVELLPRRRFGLRSVPQALVADAYYVDAFAAQGYAVVDRDVSFGV
ncbi:hypothetical protein ACFQMF_12870 [Halorubrum rutilum]|uniref:DUF58 domain-containing protein n=1 Tax=Halorubrum rutilum TaxID=1364933 RepID=A0ABD6AP04_9EURY|nr:hypothetical protein [Halorubrum rutilum]